MVNLVCAPASQAYVPYNIDLLGTNIILLLCIWVQLFEERLGPPAHPPEEKQQGWY